MEKLPGTFAGGRSPKGGIWKTGCRLSQARGKESQGGTASTCRLIDSEAKAKSIYGAVCSFANFCSSHLFIRRHA